MKALFAYTAQAYANAGFAITHFNINVWYPVGSSPFYQHQNTGQAFKLVGNEIQINASNCWIHARGFNVLETLAEGEVVTFGYRLRPNAAWGGRFQVPFTGIGNSAGSGVTPLNHLDIVDNTGPDLVSFVEVVIDPSIRAVTGYVNGKKISTTTYTEAFAAQIATDLYFSLVNANNNGQLLLISEFYAGIYNKNTGPVIMGAWACEDVVELSSELRDGDGNLTRNTVGETVKTITYKAPAPGAEVAVDVKALNPNVMSKLITIGSDGTTSSTKTNTKIETRYELSGYGVKTNAGRNIISLTPVDGAMTLTLKLRAQFLQE